MIEAMKQALDFIESVKVHHSQITQRDAICEKLEAEIEAAEKQKPVAFLANGTRFKISYDSRQSGGQIHGIPPELGGRWVAFVAAEDDCHLQLTAAQRQPLTEKEIWRQYQALWPFHPAEEPRLASDLVKFARAIEAAHGITGGKK